MARTTCRPALSLTLSFLGVVCAMSAVAQDAVLQLWNSGPAAGTIDSSAPGTSCDTTCSVAVPVGDTVTLTANPAQSNRFDGWSGDCSGLGVTCTLLVDGNMFAVASFKPAGDPLAAIHRFLPGGDGLFPRYGELLAEGGYLFGMTPDGGDAGDGTIFRELPDGSQYVVIHHFCGGASDGAGPWGSLIASGGVLYGMTLAGGASGYGTIFKVNPDGSDLVLLHSFSGGASDGDFPFDSLLEFGRVLYGVTNSGGVSDFGTIFRINLDGSDFTLVHSFTGGVSDGQWPGGSLIGSGGVLYGMTLAGGASGYGTIFKVNPDGSGFTLVHSFAGGTADGDLPSGSLIASGSALFGMTQFGGASQNGTILKVNPDGSGFALLHSFAGGTADGDLPSGSLIASGSALFGMTQFGGASQGGTIFKVNPDGTDFALVHSFGTGASDGSNPWGSLIASGGVLYGMTSAGGANLHWGTAFKINPDGSDFALLHSFGAGSSKGSEPSGPLVAFDGALYGMTYQGGVGGYGTVFMINPDGSGFALLHSFSGYPFDGSNPSGSLLVSDGVLYGMTQSGGDSYGGTIFAINPDGTGYGLIHSFAEYSSDGSNPVGSLIASGGVLYGMTSPGVESTGQSTGPSTIFRINTDGSAFAVLHSFGGGASDGSGPSGSLITFGGALYGMTFQGGGGDCSAGAGVGGCGTIFKVNPDGSGFALLHSFARNPSDGSNPIGSLIATGGVLYGMTEAGGAGGGGTVFKVNPDGSDFLLLHSFAGYPSDGSNPSGTLMTSDGSLYGMTQSGGASNLGVIFRVNLEGNDFALLHSFAGGDGAVPGANSALTALGGSLYGATNSGGLDGGGVLLWLDVPEPRVRRHLVGLS